MARQILNLAVAFISILVLPLIAIGQTNKPDHDTFICGTSEIMDEMGWHPRREPVEPPPPPEKISGSFFYQGFVTTASGGKELQLPFSFSLRVKDNVIEGNGILDGYGEIGITGRAMQRGTELSLTTKSFMVFRLTSSPLAETLRGRILNKETNEYWRFSAKRD